MSGWDANRRAGATLVVAIVAATLLAAALSPAGAQEAPAEGDPTTSTSSTTSTTAPPSTVVLDDGDIGVIPPGGEPPPDDGQPEPGAAPGTDEPAPDGEVPEGEEEPVVILPDPTPGLNAALAAIDVTAATTRVDAAREAVDAARVEVREAGTRRLAAVAARRVAVARAVEARRVVEALAVNVLVYGDISGSPATMEHLLGARSLAQLRDQVLRDRTGEHARATLDARREAMIKAIVSESRADAALRTALVERDAAEAEHLAAREELSAAIEAARQARRAVGPSILGPSILETADLVAWWQTFYPGDPPMAPIETVIDTYLAVAEAEGVAGDIAFAQAVLETGGFGSQHARRFNFAGIGAYDRCAPTCGFRFADLEAGITAHIHLLRAYADPALASDDLASPPDPRVRPERVGVRGCCPRWTALTGVWASDPNYDRKILGIYRLMVETARRLDALEQ